MSTPSDPALDALASGALDDHDAELLHDAAALYERLDPVPGGLVDRIRFAITLDALHAEVAELQRSASLVGVRSEVGAETSETITFTSPSLTIMITVSGGSAGRVRIDGWVVGGTDATTELSVEMRRPDGGSTTTTDAGGRFVFAEVERGLAQFVVRAPEWVARPPVITPSLEL